MIRLTTVILMCTIILGGCNLRLLVSNNALLRGTTNWCLPGQLCVYQVSDTSFEERYIGEGVHDQLMFTHWQQGDRHLCANSPSPCYLSTAAFDQDPRLLEVLASNQVFFLEPNIVRIQNTHYPEASPIEAAQADYIIGKWKRDNVNGARDTFALVASSDATVKINMHGLSADMDLAVLRPDPANPLDQTPAAGLVSSNPGTGEETLSFTVSSGEPYFIQVTPGSDEVVEASYSIHIEVSNETPRNTPPTQPRGTFALEISGETLACNDSSVPEHPPLPASTLILDNNARNVGRPAILTFSSGRRAELVNAATRYEPDSGTYLDRASYRLNDDSGDTLTWMVTGQISQDGTFSGRVMSWGTYRSANISCASSAMVTTPITMP